MFNLVWRHKTFRPTCNWKHTCRLSRRSRSPTIYIFLHRRMGLNGSDIELGGEKSLLQTHTMVCNLNLSPLVPFSRQLYQSVLPLFIFYSSIGVGREKCFLKGRTDRGQEVPSFHSCATHTEMNYCFLTSIKSFSFSCLLRKQSSPSFSTTVVVKWFFSMEWSGYIISSMNK
jgi:hypothetical protein